MKDDEDRNAGPTENDARVQCGGGLREGGMARGCEDVEGGSRADLSGVNPTGGARATGKDGGGW